MSSFNSTSRYKKNKWFLIFLLALILNARLVSPQSFPVRTYTIDDGLATNLLHDAAQDRSGSMWISTEIGVSSYNGSTWYNYGEKDGLPRAEYIHVRVDEGNTVWALPAFLLQPIGVFNGSKWEIIKNLPPAKNSSEKYKSFDILYENGKPVLFCGTNEGLLVLRNNVWKLLTSKNGLSDNRINCVKRIGDGIAICTASGISIYRDGRFDNSISKILGTDSNSVMAIDHDQKKPSVFWILGKNWLGEINDGKFRFILKGFRFNLMPGMVMHTYLTYDQKKRIYFGNDQERFMYDLNNRILLSLGPSNGFATTGCSNVFIDRESNVWFPSFRGLDKISDLRFQNYFQINGLLESEVTAIIEVHKGFMVFGHNHGITLFRNNVFKKISFQGQSEYRKVYGRVMDICKDSSGNIWLASSLLGLGRMNGENIKWYQSEKSQIFTSVITSQDGTVWASTQSSLFKIINDELVPVTAKNEKFNSIKKLHFDLKGDLLIATADGIIKYSNGEVKRFSIKNHPHGNNIYSICDYGNESELVGTTEGLFLFKNDSLSRINLNDFSITKKVFALMKEPPGTYWIGTNDGVIKWDGKEVRNFNISGGLAGREINRSAVMRDSFGNVWIGTDKGLSCYLIDYDSKDIPPSAGQNFLEDPNGNIYDLHKPVELDAFKNTVTFHFNSLSLKNENSIEYRIWLEGFDRKWIYTGTNNTIRYTNLLPGAYKFCYSARNSNGEWSPTSYSENIIIDKPFYKKWWFQLLSFLIVSALTYFIIKYISRYRYSSILEKEVKTRTKKLKESEEKLRYLYDSMAQGIVYQDRDAKTLTLNAAAYKILGYDPSDLVVENLFFNNDLKIIREDGSSYPVEMLPMREVLTTGHLVEKQTLGIFNRKENQYRWILANSIPEIIEGAAEPAGVFTIFTDISEQKQIQESLQKYQEELKRLSLSKNKFFSIVAHDLRSPFHGLLGMTNILISEIDDMSREQLKESLEKIFRATTNLYNLIQQLLEWSRIQTGRFEMNPVTFDLGKCTEGIVHNLKQHAESKQVTIANHIGNDILVFADELVIKSVLNNLLSNAVKFSHREGIIHLDCTKKNNLYEVCVRDEGVGISGHDLKNILRIDVSVSRKGTEGETGAGLGLILCKEMIEKYGGNLHVQSEIGKGSSFYFTIPGTDGTDW